MRLVPLFVAAWALGLFGYANAAYADWAVAGAQYSCSRASSAFELSPHDQTSDDPPEVVPVKPGFTALPDGMSVVKCQLGPRKLVAIIGVSPPQGRGMCAGSGAVDIVSLAVDGVELINEDIPFGSGCFDDKDIVVKVVVRARGASIEFERCAVPVAISGEPGSEKCTSQMRNLN